MSEDLHLGPVDVSHNHERVIIFISAIVGLVVVLYAFGKSRNSGSSGGSQPAQIFSGSGTSGTTSTTDSTSALDALTTQVRQDAGYIQSLTDKLNQATADAAQGMTLTFSNDVSGGSYSESGYGVDTSQGGSSTSNSSGNVSFAGFNFGGGSGGSSSSSSNSASSALTGSENVQSGKVEFGASNVHASDIPGLLAFLTGINTSNSTLAASAQVQGQTMQQADLRQNKQAMDAKMYEDQLNSRFGYGYYTDSNGDSVKVGRY
jgi:hypothetical protein